jgi:choline dehydrogenase-like flavoprotein
LANRLSASGEKQVLVLEAGTGNFASLPFRVPAGVLKLFLSEHDWAFTTDPQPKAADREIYFCRGKVLGGSSAMNVLLYNRGDREDYEWEKLGCVGWTADAALESFRASQEDRSGCVETAPQYHGKDGEWKTDHVRYQNVLSRTFLAACEAVGFKANPDFNDWSRDQAGFGRFLVSQRDGARCCAGSAYLAPVQHRENLTVLTGAYVRKVLLDGTNCTGAEFSLDGQTFAVRTTASGEVICAGGAVQTPQLLMLSGIGPKDHLKSLGIPTVVDSPVLGENLQDHPSAVVSYQCCPEKAGVSVSSGLRIPGTILTHPWPVLKWLFTRSGELTSTGCDHGAFFRLKNEESPDLQMRFLAARAVTADGMGSFTTFRKTPNHPDGFSFQSIAVRPSSRGRVRLRSAVPEDRPAVDAGWLDPKDLATLREGLRLSRRIAAAKDFDEFRGKEVFPGPDVQTDAQLDAYIASSVHTANAIVGTCRMGEDKKANVVDSQCRVHGCSNLRVVDASVVPRIPGGQTGPVTVMIAERAAQMITGK